MRLLPLQTSEFLILEEPPQFGLPLTAVPAFSDFGRRKLPDSAYPEARNGGCIGDQAGQDMIMGGQLVCQTNQTDTGARANPWTARSRTGFFRGHRLLRGLEGQLGGFFERFFRLYSAHGENSLIEEGVIHRLEIVQV